MGDVHDAIMEMIASRFEKPQQEEALIWVRKIDHAPAGALPTAPFHPDEMSLYEARGLDPTARHLHTVIGHRFAMIFVEYGDGNRSFISIAAADA